MNAKRWSTKLITLLMDTHTEAWSCYCVTKHGIRSENSYLIPRIEHLQHMGKNFNLLLTTWTWIELKENDIHDMSFKKIQSWITHVKRILKKALSSRRSQRLITAYYKQKRNNITLSQTPRLTIPPNTTQHHQNTKNKQPKHYSSLTIKYYILEHQSPWLSQQQKRFTKTKTT